MEKIYSKLKSSYKNWKFKCSEHTFGLGDRLYLFTDGYADQFGGAEGKKFYKKQFIDLIARISDRPMDEQMAVLHSTFMDWKDDEMQIDDVTVLGITL